MVRFAEYKFRPLIKFSYAVYMKGTLHTVQYYRLELFSHFLFGSGISFLNAFRAAPVICKMSLGAKVISKEVGVLPYT